jgi:hypothetical protein
MFRADIPSPLSHLEGDREFADSPLEGDGFELLVPRHKSRGFPQHSGHYGGIGGLLNGSTCPVGTPL